MKEPWGHILVMLVALLAFVGNAGFAQTTKQSDVPAYENAPIRRGGNSAQNAPSTQTTISAALNKAPAGVIDIRRLLLSLSLVLGLIFLMRWAGKRFFPGVVNSRANSAVRVLTRTLIAPKQHVLLVQVGRRVLVLGDNGTQMNPLSEITDPDEVAQLVGQITGAAGVSDAPQDQEFNAAFEKSKESFDAQAMPDPALAEIEPSNDGTGDVASAHGEIKGLMEKVRGLAKQFGNS